MLSLPQLTDSQDSVSIMKHSDNFLKTDFIKLRSSVQDFQVLIREMKDAHTYPGEHWYSIGSRLRLIYEHHLYRSAGYRSFSEFCQRGFGYSRQHAYKLIMVIKFIDEQEARATTEEEHNTVHRLFSLGFTKLYYLHSLPTAELKRLLDEGLPTSKHGADPDKKISLEAASVKELKNCNQQKKDSQHKLSISAIENSSSGLIALTSIQSTSLLALIEQCLNGFSQNELLVEHLQTMKQHALVITRAIGILNGTKTTLDISSRPSTIHFPKNGVEL